MIWLVFTILNHSLSSKSILSLSLSTAPHLQHYSHVTFKPMDNRKSLASSSSSSSFASSTSTSSSSSQRPSDPSSGHDYEFKTAHELIPTANQFNFDVVPSSTSSSSSSSSSSSRPLRPAELPPLSRSFRPAELPPLPPQSTPNSAPNPASQPINNPYVNVPTSTSTTASVLTTTSTFYPINNNIFSDTPHFSIGSIVTTPDGKEHIKRGTIALRFRPRGVPSYIKFDSNNCYHPDTKDSWGFRFSTRDPKTTKDLSKLPLVVDLQYEWQKNGKSVKILSLPLKEWFARGVKLISANVTILFKGTPIQTEDLQLFKSHGDASREGCRIKNRGGSRKKKADEEEEDDD